MVLLRVQLQELLHPDVGKAERVRLVSLVTGGVYLPKRRRRRRMMSSEGGREHIQNVNLKITLTLILFTMKLMLRMPMKSVP